MARDREEKDKRKRERDQQREKEKRDKQAADQARKKQEEDEQSKKLTGRMFLILHKLRYDSTPRDFSFAGLELGGPRTRLLAGHISINNSLTCLHLARKSIADPDGVQLALMLYNNKVLRKLLLEGNMLGPKTAKEIGNALLVNKTLRFLDLESNQLTQDNEDVKGMVVFIESLKQNKSLISLNVANNKLDQDMGKEFKSCLETNQTLIDFEFGFNGFHLNEVRVSASDCVGAQDPGIPQEKQGSVRC